MPRGTRYKYEDYHKEVNGILYKKCTKHHEFFPEEDEWLHCTSEYFYINSKNKSDGLHPECKRCSRAKTLDRYYNDGGITKQKTIQAAAIRYHTVESDKQIKLKNGQRQREEGYQSQWRKDNLEKCRHYCSLHKAHDVSKKEEDAMLKVFNYQCAYCGISLKEHKKKFGEKLHNDHVDDNGYNDLRNDVPACKSCNCSKHTNIMKEWYEKQSFYSKERYNKIIWWITEGYKEYIEDKPSYKITRRRIDDGNNKYHYVFELWSIDEKRNMIELLDTKSKKKYLDLSLV